MQEADDLADQSHFPSVAGTAQVQRLELSKRGLELARAVEDQSAREAADANLYWQADQDVSYEERERHREAERVEARARSKALEPERIRHQAALAAFRERCKVHQRERQAKEEAHRQRLSELVVRATGEAWPS